MPLCVYFNGFWSGFHECTNGVNVNFFIHLLEKVYTMKVEATLHIEKAQILVENTQVYNSKRTVKTWYHTYLFSGESYIRPDWKDYSCVLFGQRTHDNIVNCPLYLAYLESSFQGISSLQQASEPIVPPKQQILVLISNPGGHVRNALCDRLEKEFDVVYAGNYKNTTGGAIKEYMTSPAFLDYVKQFRFVVAAENSQQETYITEKIIHPLLTHTIPIYWGSPRVLDYFNEDRILHMKDLSELDSLVASIRKRMDSDEAWIQTVKQPPLTRFGELWSLDTIAQEIRTLLFFHEYPLLRRIYFLCNPDFEPARYESLQAMCKKCNIPSNMISFVCPTFKHTITDKDMTHYVKGNKIYTLRRTPMKKAEVSLFLNWRAVLEEVEKRYSNPNDQICIFESDVFALDNWRQLNKLLETLKGNLWSCVHIGGISNPTNEDPFHVGVLPYVSSELTNMDTLKQVVKDDCLTSSTLFRKFHTRCTDSFVFSVKGCVQLANRLCQKDDYDVPFDYYFTQFAVEDHSFKMYWSWPSYFDQKSNRGLDASTIQSS